jgi:hypothetical protein
MGNAIGVLLCGRLVAEQSLSSSARRSECSGFPGAQRGRAQLAAVGDTKTFGSTAVNELHFSFMRDATDLGRPIGGVGNNLASQGFVVGTNTPGIVPLSPQTEGVESVNFNNFSIGTNTNQLRQVNNTWQWRDGFSKVTGTHTIKVGAEFHYDQVNTKPGTRPQPRGAHPRRCSVRPPSNHPVSEEHGSQRCFVPSRGRRNSAPE